MPEITLHNDYGLAKKGEIYVQGLHETPDCFKNTHTRTAFYWKRGSERKDNLFLMAQHLIELGEYQQNVLNR